MKKTILAMSVALGFGFGAAHAATTITFDPTGTAGAAGDISGVALFDWAVGNALAIGGNPTGGLATGDKTTLLYQANLAVVNDISSGILFANGTSGYRFTAVAGFGEVATVGAGGSSATFAFDGSNKTNFYKIYAVPALGNNLTGAGFTSAQLILSGHVTGINSSNFNVTSDFTTCNDYVTTGCSLLDKSANGDQWSGTKTIVGSGSSDIKVMIDWADVNYFPDLPWSSLIALSMFNTSQVLPYNQVDPSRCFTDLAGTMSCMTAANIGAVNGGYHVTGDDRNLIMQADANQSFGIPEPTTMALLGIGLAGMGYLSRRRQQG